MPAVYRDVIMANEKRDDTIAYIRYVFHARETRFVTETEPEIIRA